MVYINGYRSVTLNISVFVSNFVVGLFLFPVLLFSLPYFHFTGLMKIVAIFLLQFWTVWNSVNMNCIKIAVWCSDVRNGKLKTVEHKMKTLTNKFSAWQTYQTTIHPVCFCVQCSSSAYWVSGITKKKKKTEP